MSLSREHSDEFWSSKASFEKVIENSSEVFCDLCLCETKNIECLKHACEHKFCNDCLYTFLTISIGNSEVQIKCPALDCNFFVHPCDIYRILLSKCPEQIDQVREGEKYIERYERFMVRQVLQNIQHTRWCPAPDCTFAVIGNSQCPIIECLRPGCNTFFCYFCKRRWHPGLVCTEQKSTKTGFFRRLRFGRSLPKSRKMTSSFIKRCPTCSALITKKPNKGCNEMKCTMCKRKFCWLCNKPTGNLHFFGANGCTFYGRRTISRKEMAILISLGLLFFPVAIGAIACVCVPVIFIGLPTFLGKEIYRKVKRSGRGKYIGIASSIAAGLCSVPIVIASSPLLIPVASCASYWWIMVALWTSYAKEDDDVDFLEMGNFDDERNAELDVRHFSDWQDIDSEDSFESANEEDESNALDMSFCMTTKSGETETKKDDSNDQTSDEARQVDNVVQRAEYNTSDRNFAPKISCSVDSNNDCNINRSKIGRFLRKQKLPTLRMMSFRSTFLSRKLNIDKFFAKVNYAIKGKINGLSEVKTEK